MIDGQKTNDINPLYSLANTTQHNTTHHTVPQQISRHRGGKATKSEAASPFIYTKLIKLITLHAIQ